MITRRNFLRLGILTLVGLVISPRFSIRSLGQEVVRELQPSMQSPIRFPIQFSIEKAHKLYFPINLRQKKKRRK